MQVLPSKELLPYIKHYLFLKSEGESIRNLRLFTDGNTGVVFTFYNNIISNFKNHELPEYLPNSFVYGQLSEFKDIYLHGETRLIIVVFQPWGINQLLGIPADKLRDYIIPTEDLFGRKGTDLQEKLSEQKNILDKLSLLNDFFIEIIKIKTFNENLIIQASIRLIVQFKGLVSVSQLVRYTGYTQRHIERKFSESIGLNPKMFCNIVKLHSFLKYMKEKPASDIITGVAYEAGYFDQSHLVKEFRKYTGMTPREYVKNTTKLTVNFVEFHRSDLISDYPMSDLYNFSDNGKTNFVLDLINKKYGQIKNIDSSI
jgi:AraC-like DNA-binding protein